MVISTFCLVLQSSELLTLGYTTFGILCSSIYTRCNMSVSVFAGGINIIRPKDIVSFAVLMMMVMENNVGPKFPKMQRL